MSGRFDGDDMQAAADELVARPWGLVWGGAVHQPKRRGTFDSIDPSTEGVLTAVPDGDASDVALAVEAAEVASGPWGRLTMSARATAVRRLADAVEQHAEELALLDAVDGGLPLALARRDIATACATLRWFAGIGPRLHGETVPVSEHLHFTERCPFGVVVRIVAFNHPAMFAIGKSAAPLVAGNAVVIKPSDAAPLSALRFREIAAEVLPPGIVSVLVGQGPEVPQALVEHPAVRRIGFIGSDVVGRSIQERAARAGVKTVSLELGGKNGLLAYPDVDPAVVAKAAVEGMNFMWSGQSCGSTSRLVVHRSIADEVVDRVARSMADLRVGPALDPGIDQGPLISRGHWDRVDAHVQRASAEGADILVGGGRPASLSRGCFYAPTLVDGVTPDSPIAQLEVFGPVLTVLRWDEEDEAMAIMNGVDFGLTASVFSSNVTTAVRSARAVDAGFVWVNGVSRHFPGLPYGGVKASGVGRDESIDELESFTEVRSTTIFLE